MANCGLLLNDGSSFVLLNDGASAILLNDSSCAFEPGQGGDQQPTSGSANYLVWWNQQWDRIRAERKRRVEQKVPKEKRDVLEQYDTILLELRSRIAEQEAEARWQEELRQLEAFADLAMDARITHAMVLERIWQTEELLREMDDEEAILLALH